jgi:hypothetical protein
MRMKVIDLRPLPACPERKLPTAQKFNYWLRFSLFAQKASVVTQMLVPNHTQWRKRFCMSLMVCIVRYIVYMTELSCSLGRRITEIVPARAKIIISVCTDFSTASETRRTECKQRLPKTNLVLAQRAMRLVLLFERDPYQTMENLGSWRYTETK